MVENVLNVVDQLADLVWAGFISASAIAGVGIGQSYKMLVMTGRLGLDTALRATVSRAIGAVNPALANHYALQGFTLSAGYSLIMVLIGVFLTVPLMRVLGLSEDIIDSGSLYLRIQFIGTGAMAFRQTSGSALVASGDAITPMKGDYADQGHAHCPDPLSHLRMAGSSRNGNRRRSHGRSAGTKPGHNLETSACCSAARPASTFR